MAMLKYHFYNYLRELQQDLAMIRFIYHPDQVLLIGSNQQSFSVTKLHLKRHCELVIELYRVYVKNTLMIRIYLGLA